MRFMFLLIRLSRSSVAQSVDTRKQKAVCFTRFSKIFIVYEWFINLNNNSKCIIFWHMGTYTLYGVVATICYFFFFWDNVRSICLSYSDYHNPWYAEDHLIFFLLYRNLLPITVVPTKAKEICANGNVIFSNESRFIK